MASKNTTSKKAQAKVDPVVNEDTRPDPVRKKTVKLDDSVLISVKSNTFGGLIYVNPRTGDKTEWNGCGDVQTLFGG